MIHLVMIALCFFLASCLTHNTGYPGNSARELLVAAVGGKYVINWLERFGRAYFKCREEIVSPY